MVKKKTDERRPCIYCAKNKITNKYYVGQTRYGLKHRQIQHFDRAYNKKRNTRFCRALRRYGQDNFVWETLYIVRKDNLTPEQLQFLLNMREKAWVKYFNSFENGYNQNEGGSGGVKYKYATLEEKRKAQNQLQNARRAANREVVNARQNARRAANREEYNAAMKARREARPKYRQQRKEYRDQKEALNPELKIQRLESHKKYMKENRQSRRAANREQYNAQMKARREIRGEEYRQQRKEYRDQKEALNPELKTQRQQKHREYMKENQNKRRAKKRDQINARQNARREAKIAKIGHEAYRAAFNERRRKRKEQKLIETNN